MTQASDVAGRVSRLDSPRADEASTSPTPVSLSKVGTFAITFSTAFTLLYTVYERLNWPLFTVLPVGNKWYFGIYRPLRGEGPPMYWYGWIVLAAMSALVVAFIAIHVSERLLRRATVFCCVLAALWPTCLVVLRAFSADWASLDAEFMNSVWAAAVPGLAGTAAITYFVPAELGQRAWTSWLFLVPIGGLAVLGYSLLQYFVR
jgi:hypothetical protein